MAHVLVGEQEEYGSVLGAVADANTQRRDFRLTPTCRAMAVTSTFLAERSWIWASRVTRSWGS